MDPENETRFGRGKTTLMSKNYLTYERKGAIPVPKKQYSPEEKLKIVLEALKEERLITDIASDYGIIP